MRPRTIAIVGLNKRISDMAAPDSPWQQACALGRWLGEYKDEGDATEFLDRWGKFTKTLEEIASDPSLSSDDRSAARQILYDVALHARAHLPTAIRTLAHLAENADAPNIRDGATRGLSNVTRHLPAASEKLQ
jgi:hypothetical protein